ncbi:dTDP-4-dehydrorhamnose 3,5-epimerase family protein, partial [Acinetobacter baumannii]
MSRFTIAPTPLAGVVEIDRTIIGDHRGYFTRFVCAEELAAAGFDSPVAQMNHSHSAKRGT